MTRREKARKAEAVPARPERGPMRRTSIRRALLWLVGNVEEVLCAVLLGAMLASVGLGVLFRFVLQDPLGWTEEVVLVCMVWACLLGASVATKHNEHILIDIVLVLVPTRIAQGMRVLAQGLVVAFLSLFAWQGLVLVDASKYTATTALGIPMVYVYAAVPVSAICMLVHNVRGLYALIRPGRGE